MSSTPSPTLPTAERRRRRSPYWLLIWLLPLLALAISALLFYLHTHYSGLLITVELQRGYGLSSGNGVRYRGIEVGRVETVSLSRDLSHIAVEVRLLPEAVELAREGSSFWVVRPQLALTGAAGLDTLIGANYIAVLPGDGAPQRRFVGLEDPPLAELTRPNGLRVTLRSGGRGGLQVGAPVSYRQVTVGTLTQVDLSADASAVETEIYIYPRYRSLVRANTVFWRSNAVSIGLDISGLSVDVDSLSGLLLGGVSLAVPPDPGREIEPDHRFVLHEEASAEWLRWTTSIAMENLRPGSEVDLVRARLSWRVRPAYLLYATTQERTRTGWLLPVAGGLLGPADLLRAPAQAVAAPTLTLDERSVARLGIEPRGDHLAFLPGDFQPPMSPRRRAAAPEDSLIAIDGDNHRFIAADRFTVADGRWQVDSALPFGAQWHGGAVVAQSDGAVIGILLVEEQQAAVVPLHLALPLP